MSILKAEPAEVLCVGIALVVYVGQVHWHTVAV